MCNIHVTYLSGQSPKAVRRVVRQQSIAQYVIKHDMHVMQDKIAYALLRAVV
jgi:hypothetical protein